MFYDTGIRVSELCGLRVGDIDRKHGLLTVTGKGSKQRRIALDNLIDPAYTKNKRVRNLAKHVKSRLNQLRKDQQESTDRGAASACQMEQKVQNLPLRLPKVALTVDSGGGNLRVDDLVEDSGSFIDNDRDLSSTRILPENQTIVSNSAAPESTIREPRVLYRPVDARSAQVLAKFVESHPGIAMPFMREYQAMRCERLSIK